MPNLDEETSVLFHTHRYHIIDLISKLLSEIADI